jgi:phosphoribosyl 1,2-cyclic phosphodiesterase
VGTDRTRVLIDAGLSRKETFARLARIGEDPEKLTAILVTHEHSDHINGLVRIARKLNIPVYCTRLTVPAIRAMDWLEYQPRIEAYQAGTRFVIGDLEVDSFTIPHDAVDPVGYTIRSQGIKVGIATDLGYIPESIAFHLRRTDFLVLESNHDVEMLKVGPYPWSVKQRVMGRRGHLSNDVVSEFIRTHLDSCISNLLLGHLSEHNNHPEIVRLVASQALERRGMTTRLWVAEAGRQSEVYCY